MSVLIAARAVSKNFGPVQALKNVDVAVEAGSVHAVTGENGAGKSTLMKMFAGVITPTTGSIEFKGRTVKIQSPLQALHMGISTVFQEFTLIPNLTVAENIFLGRAPRTGSGGIDYKKLNADASGALGHIGSRLRPTKLVQNLTVAEQQIVEIAKGVAADADVFIFDEPTAALNTADVSRLVALIRELKVRGKAILYISHRLEEIFELCDTVSVLKDGVHIATRPTVQLNEQSLVALMVGRELSDFFPPRAREIGTAILRVGDLVIDGAEPVTLELRRGEILGLAGLEGQGQREIVRALAGVIPASFAIFTKTGPSGEVVTLDASNGVPYLVGKGIGFVPEDRKGEGLFLDLTILENVALGPQLRSAPWRLAAKAKQMVTGLMQSMSIKARSPMTRAGALSGGNQQKVLIARWLASGVDVLLIEEPTRGVDVGAKSEIYKLLRKFVADGGAVLTLSRELPELIGLCDRILVVHEQKIVADVEAAETNEHAIIHSAIGTRQESTHSVAA